MRSRSSFECSKQGYKRAVFVTGASQGIGESITSVLVEDGWNVLASAVPADRGVLAKAVRAHRAGGGCAEAIYSDLASPTAAARLARTLGRNPTICGLVLCASIQIREPFNVVSYETAIRQFNVNFWANLELIRAVIPAMRSRGWGRIVFVSSVQEWIPHPEMTVYAAMKAAMSNVIANLALSEAPFGITVNSIAPGTTATPRLGSAVNDSAYQNMLPKRIPVGRLGLPSEIAAVCRMLFRNDGAFVTGVRIPVDGGMRLARPPER